ncbi:conserved hypothetical protein [Leishmania mexicana MHOM/GT/2001/U1103]|uniref:Uncharacterized protein n=1 Tax=Leishmania mexicana (strain MHOM/GT/2001/U1103) TaxID=929439 RepID=E9AW35_LEIMU|nr:conserved hypothetical protein [Leishmania mexicana MHOM/GT/2001/U1103]CBZ27169.1 conserved hypothetical protein [Leishmania mexicana MHOM/GT/2001/U1103]
MSGALPTPLTPSYSNSGAAYREAHFGHAGCILRPHRAPLNRGIRRTAECPCAVRLYHMTGQDIAARSEYCSVVLGAPSVGIPQGVQPGAPPPPTGDQAVAAAGAGPSLGSTAGASVVERPIAVQLAWADTTVWEVALTALQAVRSKVDAAYKSDTKRAARQANGRITAPTPAAQGRRQQGAEEDSKNSEDDEEEAPYSTPLPHYQVELLTGTVSSEGRASVLPLCMVHCRQVVYGHSALLPVRRGDCVDYNTAMYELPYNLGDPVFVTCTRTR